MPAESHVIFSEGPEAAEAAEAAEAVVRVYSLGGKLLLEREAIGAVADLLQDLSLRLRVSRYRLKLMAGEEELQEELALDGHSDLQLIIGEVDLRRNRLQPGRIVSVRRAGATHLEVAVQPGILFDTFDATQRVCHRVRLKGPGNLRLPYEAVEEENKVMLRVKQSSFAMFYELLLHYSWVSLETFLRDEQGFEYNSDATRWSPSKCCRAASFQALLRMTFAVVGYWFIDCLSLAASMYAAVLAVKSQHYVQAELLMATLWLPGLLCTMQAMYFGLGDKVVGPLFSVGVLIPSCFLMTFWCTCSMLRLLLHLNGFSIKEPWLDLWDYLPYEFYMSYVRRLGDGPRLVLCFSLFLLGEPLTGSEPIDRLVLASAALALLQHARGRHLLSQDVARCLFQPSQCFHNELHLEQNMAEQDWCP